jgi:regulator of protease activity HflC (stomatin/prohibitin superfamily)
VAASKHASCTEGLAKGVEALAEASKDAARHQLGAKLAREMAAAAQAIYLRSRTHLEEMAEALKQVRLALTLRRSIAHQPWAADI